MISWSLRPDNAYTSVIQVIIGLDNGYILLPFSYMD